MGDRDTDHLFLQRMKLTGWPRKGSGGWDEGVDVENTDDCGVDLRGWHTFIADVQCHSSQMCLQPTSSQALFSIQLYFSTHSPCMIICEQRPPQYSHASSIHTSPRPCLQMSVRHLYMVIPQAQQFKHHSTNNLFASSPILLVA